MSDPSVSTDLGAPPGPKRELSLFDSTCIIVGIIVGVGIFQTAPDIAGAMGHPVGALAI